MYSRRSLRPPQAKPTVPHGSAMTTGPSSLWGMSLAGEQQQQPPYEMRSSQTMPTHNMTNEELVRSQSGNLFFRRNRSGEDTQEKARELSERLELSEDRNLELNKSGNFANTQEVRRAPVLGANMMNPAQAAAMIAEANKKKNEQAQNNPLLTERERLEASSRTSQDHYDDMSLSKTLTFETVSSTSSAGVDIVLTPSNEAVVRKDDSLKQKFGSMHDNAGMMQNKKMSRGEKRILLARQAMQNKVKRDIPDLC